MTGRETIRRLTGLGCVVERHRGSHVRVRCGPCRTTVPVHRGRDLPPGTLRAIERLAPDVVTIDQIISMMVGRTIYEAAPEVPENASPEVVLEVKNLNRGNTIKDVSFNLKRGEILGFAGLMGAGRTEVARAIFGADRLDRGEIAVEGRPVHIRSPRQAIRAGIGFVTEDRKGQGLVLPLSVGQNVTLAALDQLTRGLHIPLGRERALVAEFMKKLRIRASSADQKVMDLSGGNQQKVVLSKWLFTDPQVLILDEPTRGIDVGSKSEIYQIMDGLTKQGVGIIMISSELPEVLGMSDRIMVMRQGRIVKELSRAEASEEAIMKYAVGSEAA